MINLKNVEIGINYNLFTIDDVILEKGKLYSLIGRNGSGKSTFLKTLAEIIPPHSGKIEWQKKSPKEHRIAFVPSKFDGIDYLTTYDFIALGRAPYTNIFGKLSSEDHLKILEISDHLNITNLLEKSTSEISDGERQIANIAKAITQNTELIILDEPTAFLDYENKLKITQILADIAKIRDCCIIHSSHDLEFSLKFGSEILIIDSENHKLLQTQNQTIDKNEIIKLAFPNAQLLNT